MGVYWQGVYIHVTSTCPILNPIIWFRNVSVDRTIKEDDEYWKIVEKKFYHCEQGVIAHTSRETAAGESRV